MNLLLHRETQTRINVEIRVRGRVQGVGFRPTVWRLANELELTGEVRNDPAGVLIRVSGPPLAVDRMMQRLRIEAPPLASIEQIDAREIAPIGETAFHIRQTIAGPARTQVAPDAGMCSECAREVLDPRERRFRYPFANCTHCGPRLSIVTAIPYDRANTTMSDFGLCEQCAREYNDPADRRFHAEAIGCAACGPKTRLVRLFADCGQVPDGVDDTDITARALAQGLIVAIKGLGGYQLACDATNEAAVVRLRTRKMRPAKPFALMARDLELIHRYCSPTPQEERLLAAREAPIILMAAGGPERLPDAVAPGLRTLGFMLPATPLHLRVLRGMDCPVVMTSGNVTDEPQIVDDDEALQRLAGIADLALVHDRRIAIRIDDSVVRTIAGVPRLFRRARGYAPAPIKLPSGFEAAPNVLAFGSDMKAAFCIVKNGEAILSQHQGELDGARTYDEFVSNLRFYAELFAHTPDTLACDLHPDYRSSKLARERARRDGVSLIEVQHHHAHVAACLAENGRSLASPPVLGIVLDGLGWGSDGTIWGGEFLLADYCDFERLGTFKPVPLIGGDQAVREPWRSLYAHLTAEMRWSELSRHFGQLQLCEHLSAKPRAMLDQMVCRSINAPIASSCGRLFDAVAAALGICRERQRYEGEAASRLEAAIDDAALNHARHGAYPFATGNPPDAVLPFIEPLPMWKVLLGDLIQNTPASVIAARFHLGLAHAVVEMALTLARGAAADRPRFDTVALSGGCFQNAALFNEVEQRLRAAGFTVLSQAQVPANDGGLALGQAAVAAARRIRVSSKLGKLAHVPRHSRTDHCY